MSKLHMVQAQGGQDKQEHDWFVFGKKECQVVCLMCSLDGSEGDLSNRVVVICRLSIY